MKACELESSQPGLKVPHPHTFVRIELDDRPLTSEMAPLGREGSLGCTVAGSEIPWSDGYVGASG